MYIVTIAMIIVIGGIIIGTISITTGTITGITTGTITGMVGNNINQVYLFSSCVSRIYDVFCS